MRQMTYLFDTSILISFFRKSSPDALSYIKRVQNKAITASLSSITFYEIWRGARTDRQLLEAKTLLRPYTIHPFTKPIARIASDFYKSFPDKQLAHSLSHDIMIAATAEYFHYDLVTTNGNDFQLIPIKEARLIPI
jgi:predicted nucleic acid-binding protein